MIEINIPMKPVSVNSFYYATRKVKTAESRQWEACFLEFLEDYRKGLAEIAEDFQENGGVFRIYITCYYPHFIFYNQSKTISSKTIDVDNVLKPICDMIFREGLAINDKYIVECVSRKRPGATYNINIVLELNNSTDAE